MSNAYADTATGRNQNADCYPSARHSNRNAAGDTDRGSHNSPGIIAVCPMYA